MTSAVRTAQLHVTRVFSIIVALSMALFTLVASTDPMVIWGGILAGFVVLAIIFVIMRVFSVRLPLKTLFMVMSILMFIMSISFLGSGINELIEGKDIHLEADISALANNFGFGVGDWVPYLTVDYKVLKADGSVEAEGTFMEMSASDGPHYGSNIAMPSDQGTYTLEITIKSPADNNYLLHTDAETGPGAKSFDDGVTWPLVVLKGRSGSGKSTLLNMMAGLLEPSEGKVLLDGRDVYALDDAELSGGELRRMAIARALVCEPKVVFADKPTGDLDDENTDAVLGMLRRIADDGAAVLLVTHEQVADGYADRIVRMDAGVLR